MAYTTINKSTDYFNTVTYQGSGGNNFAISSLDFAPNLTWIKRMTSTQNHFLFDTVRGNNKYVNSNTSGQEYTEANSFTFDSNGFTFPTYWDALSDSSGTTAAWNWKANGSGSANTDGSISSTVSANTTAGFSISKYTGNATNGATVGHGLGAVPEMLIGKDLSDTSGWGVWHKDLTNAGYRLDLSTNAAQSDDTALFGGSSRTAPTSSVFTLGSGGGLNGSNANIMYAFTSITGYSKFGSYIGNNNADGTFIYTGFKPAFVIIKESSGTGDWELLDNKRLGYNPRNESLSPNLNSAEGNYNRIDILSNGFKVRDTSGNVNTSGGTYIYMAFAEAPLVGSNGVTAKAR